MAITRDKKQALVAEMSQAIVDAKAIAFARYAGLTVADMQTLRKSARENGVSIRVVKNRLVRVSMTKDEAFKDTDTTMLEGQLLYAISSEDEVAPSKVLHDFAKTNPSLVLAGGFSGIGEVQTDAQVKELAGLPSKDQLIAQTIAQLLSPVHDTVNALSGNLHALLDGVEAKATA